jgi:hypothetical protein
LVEGKASIYFTRSGANDPNFNLRHEPAMIIRKKGHNTNFISVVEIHGSYDPKAEFSSGSYSTVKQIKMLVNDANISVAEILIGGKKLLLAQANKDFDRQKSHSYNGITWTGPYAVFYDEKLLKP